MHGQYRREGRESGAYGEGEPAILDGRVGLEDEDGVEASCDVGEGAARAADHADDGHREQRPYAERFGVDDERIVARCAHGRCRALCVGLDADRALPCTAPGGERLWIRYSVSPGASRRESGGRHLF